MQRPLLSVVAMSFLAVACSKTNAPSCTDDCDSYHRNASLVRRVVADTSLPICDDASIFESRPSGKGDGTVDYEVLVIMEGYCPASLIATVDARLNKQGLALFQTASGVLVSITSIYPRYSISISRQPIGNVR